MSENPYDPPDDRDADSPTDPQMIPPELRRPMLGMLVSGILITVAVNLERSSFWMELAAAGLFLVGAIVGGWLMLGGAE